MFITETFENTRLLTKFIRENEIKKQDIVSIILNPENRYVLFYYT